MKSFNEAMKTPMVWTHGENECHLTDSQNSLHAGQKNNNTRSLIKTTYTLNKNSG